MITNRGIKVYPDGFPETFCTDHWRCRFKPTSGSALPKSDIIALLEAAAASGIDVIKTENLYAFDGKPAFSLGQGQ
jgi:isocitrate dehydrogenase